MKRKILFTGHGRIVRDDLIDHVPDDYQPYKCAPTELEFLQALDRYQPDVVVTALSKETSVTLRMYDGLKERAEYFHLPIIAIGSEDDCELFRNNVFQKNMECFIRPIDVDKFMNKLHEFSTLLGNSNPVTEFLDEKMAAFKDAGMKLRQEATEPVNPATYGTSRQSILVVDDDVRMLNVIKAYLEELYDIAAVPSGQLALKYLNKKHADLVLLDYMMPEMDGPTVLKNIREGHVCPDIPVIFLTGVADKEKVMVGLEQRPNGYILKPATRETILDRVTEVLLGL